MISEEQIKEKIVALTQEQNLVQQTANNYTAEYNRVIGEKQNRFQQIKGQLLLLNELLNKPNGEKPT